MNESDIFGKASAASDKNAIPSLLADAGIAAAPRVASKTAKKSHKKKTAVRPPPAASSRKPGETRGKKTAVRNLAPPSQDIDLFSNIQSGSMRRFAKAQESALESLSNKNAFAFGASDSNADAEADVDVNADSGDELEDAAISSDSSKVPFCMSSTFFLGSNHAASHPCDFCALCHFQHRFHRDAVF